MKCPSHSGPARRRTDVGEEPYHVEQRVAPAALRRRPLVVLGRHVGDRDAGELARDFGRTDGRLDLAGVNQVVGHVELLQPVEKERPLLRILDGVPRIELHLRRIRFDFREIGPVGPVEQQIVGDPPPHVGPKLRTRDAVMPSRIA